MLPVLHSMDPGLHATYFTFTTNWDSVPCTPGPGTEALSSFCSLVTCDSSLTSRAFNLLQPVQVTECAPFINDSPTHSR